MLWAFQITLFLFVLGAPPKGAITTNEPMVDSAYFQNGIQNLGTQKGSFRQQIQCRWNCQIVESDLGSIIQVIVITEGRKLRLAFNYEKIVEQDCVSRASHNSNGSLAEYWHVWMVNHTSFGGNVLRGFSTLTEASFEDQLKVLCRFRKANSPGKETLYGELSSPSEHLENILRSTVRSLGEMCDAQLKDDAQICFQINRLNHDTQWKDFVLHCLIIAFVIAFTYFGPAAVCLYSTTEDTCDEICQRTVVGHSPVGFQSLVANYLFSTHNDMCHRARGFILHVILLPIPFLAPAIFVEYFMYQNLLPDPTMLGISHFVPPFRILCYGCFYFNAFYLHILREKAPDNERPCNEVEELPQRMLRHLRIVGSTLKLLCSISVNLFKDICRDPSSSPIIVRFFYATVSLVLIPVVFVYGFLWFKFLILMSFPIATVWATTEIVGQSEMLQPLCPHGLLTFWADGPHTVLNGTSKPYSQLWHKFPKN